jgi:hypothetical protein
MLARRLLEVGSGDTSDILLALSPTAELTGMVHAEGLGGVARFEIELTAVDGYNVYPSRTVVGESGVFTIAGIGPGKYRLRVHGIPENAYLKSMTRGDTEVVAMGLEVSARSGAAPVRILVSGLAAELDGRVDAEAIVTLVPVPSRPEQPWLYRVAKTGKDGQFRMTGVAPGRYRLFAWEHIDTDAHYDLELLRPPEGQGLEVELTEKERRKVDLQRISVAKQPAR